MAIEKSGKCIEDEWKGVHFSMPKDVKLLVESFAKDRKQKKQYVLTLLICAVMVSLFVAWGFKLTGISATADDTEMAEALEAMQKLNAMEEESTQESNPQDTEMTNDTDDSVSEDVKTDNTESDSSGENDESNTDVNTDASDAEDEESVDNAETQNVELLAETENGITVTVEGDDDAFPYPADELTVEAKKVDDSDVVTLRDEIMEDEDVQAMDHILLSVSIFHEGEEVELTGPVNVTFSGIDTDGYETKVYQIDAEAQDGEEMDSSVDEDGDVTVETDSFAVYDVSRVAETDGDYTLISTASELNNISSGGKYRLKSDIVFDAYISISQNTTLDLAGYKIYYKGTSFFNVSSGATLTIEDSSAQSDTEESFSGTYGNIASLQFASDGNKPTELTYYVTQSEVNSDGISTTETTKKHTMKPSGCIVGESTNGNEAIVKVGNGGAFNLTGGLLTIRYGDRYSGDSHIVCNNGTMNMTGGYICGGKDYCWGGGIYSGSGSNLNIEGGVIAANEGTNGGGVCVENGTFIMSDGVISGNKTKDTVSTTITNKYDYGQGGGVYLKNSTATISGGYITNNKENYQCSNKDSGYGCHGGGGVATLYGTLSLEGGYITGNYSYEAGGGLYIGHFDAEDNKTSVTDTKFEMKGGTVADNCADHSEGGGIRVSGYATGVINTTSKSYITNNETKTTNDWGGGGIFVQTKGTLNVKNSLITNNTAQGFGGGVGACPTGQTLLLHEVGAAIYKNTANGYQDHMSGGTGGKNEDKTVALDSSVFTTDKGYQDYFCVTATSNKDYISLVTGMMLGGGAANWKGSCDRKNIEISKNGYAAAKQIFGLTANPESDSISKAINNAMVFITGNKSNIHGGGIMTNGNLILGNASKIKTTTTLDISATKQVTMGGEIQSSGLDFTFLLTDEDGNVLKDADGNEITATSDATTGKFTISPNVKYEQSGTYTYYLKEKNDGRPGIIYDSTCYKIDVVVSEKSLTVCGVTFTTYYIKNATVNKIDSDSTTGSEESTSFKVHYKNEKNWSQVYMHIWECEDLGVSATTWPGNSVNADENNDGWYTYTFDNFKAGSFKCIFDDGTTNNPVEGTNKTAEITVSCSQGQEIWLDGSEASMSKPADWISSSTSNVDFTKVINSDETCSLTINNTAFTNERKQYELPATGGTGTFKFAIGGLFLMTGSLLYGYSLKRRRERRARS